MCDFKFQRLLFKNNSSTTVTGIKKINARALVYFLLRLILLRFFIIIITCICVMSSLGSLTPYIKNFKGFLPVNKPKGVCSIKTLYALRLDADFTLTHYGTGRKSVDVYCARQLDPFASGLVTYVFNQSNYRRRNFIHADYRYRATVEFGVDRVYNCIDGEVLERSSVKHLNVDLINEALSHFQGNMEQKFSSSYKYMTEIDAAVKGNQSAADMIYNRIEAPTMYVRPQREQKYPYTKPRKDVTCYSSKLLEFNNPFATLELHCRGSLNMRQLAVDLGEKLGTKASLVELTRTQEGPITLDDMRVIQFHELKLEQYLPKMSVCQRIYDQYITQFDDFFDTDPTFRPRM